MTGTKQEGALMNITRSVLALPAVVAMLALAGCGGGSSSSSCTSCTVGGMVSGLQADEGVTLVNNDGEALMVSADGGFTFANPQAGGSAYDITVKSHTPGIACSVANGSGTVGTSDVTAVAVACAPGTESVLYSFLGGTTDGLRPAAGLIMDSAGNLYGTTSAGGPNISTGGSDGDGTVFEVRTSGTQGVLYFFAGSPTDGLRPYAGLVMDSAGNLYGTTEAGGANLDGTVFKLSPTGTETVLYSFGAVPDGSGPFAGLIMDGAGNLYGTTFAGGAASGGTVFKLSPTGAESVLYSFNGGTTDGDGPRAGLIMDSAGNLYGTTSAGGSSNDGTVFKLSPAGTETILYSFKGGTSDGAIPDSGVIADGTGNLYGITGSGGANNRGTVFKISAASTESILYSFAGGASDGSGPVGLMMDSAGNLYGTTNFGGAYCVSQGGCGTVFKMN